MQFFHGKMLTDLVLMYYCINVLIQQKGKEYELEIF